MKLSKREHALLAIVEFSNRERLTIAERLADVARSHGRKRSGKVDERIEKIADTLEADIVRYERSISVTRQQHEGTMRDLEAQRARAERLLRTLRAYRPKSSPAPARRRVAKRRKGAK